MRFSSALVAAAIAGVGQVQAAPFEGSGLDSRQTDPALPEIDPSSDAVNALLELQKAVEQALANHEENRDSSSKCTLANARVRKNWYVKCKHLQLLLSHHVINIDLGHDCLPKNARTISKLSNVSENYPPRARLSGLLLRTATMTSSLSTLISPSRLTAAVPS
jgi:hypothetical protein